MHGVSVFTPGLAGRITEVARLRIPGIGMLDGARGVSAVSGTATCFPVGMARGATWDEALEECVGEAIGAETRAKGGSMILAPVVNILRHPRWGRAQETYGEDTVHLGRMGVAFVRGTQRHVIANPKHYALNSIENTRFAVDVAVDERSYRYLDRNDTAPLFPFGFGLAYTTFRYSNLAITPATVSPWGRVRVTAEVTNTGPVAGDEVAQLYVGYTGSRVARAVRDLKAFARIHLEPGETRTVPFEVRAPDLAYWDAGAGAFVVEPIAYTVEVGPSSRDLPLAGAFAVSP